MKGAGLQGKRSVPLQFSCLHAECLNLRWCTMAVFILETHNPSGTNLRKHFFLRMLNSSSIKTGTGSVMRLDELSILVPRGRRTKEEKFVPHELMRLEPVFILLIEFNRSRKKVCQVRPRWII